MAPRRLIACAVASAATALAACAADPPGIMVTVDLAEFAPRTANLKVAISASPDGFKPHPRDSVEGVSVETEDVDGDGTLELVAHFLAPRSPVSFRVATGNMADLVVRGQAIAFDTDKVIAGADGVDTALPAGGRGSIALALKERMGGPIGPSTRVTDIKTAPPDVTVGTSMDAHLSAVAVCDLDDDDRPDLVIGAPQAGNLGLQSVGAVYVLLGGGGLGSEIDLGNPATAMEFHFFGQGAGDQLGAAIACADLTKDGVADLIVAAPGAASVYAVIGGRDIRNRTIMPGTTGAAAPDVTWRSAAGGSFGAVLFAADLNGDRSAELLVAAPGNRKVHLFTGVTQAVAAPINADAADHVTFANVAVTSLAAGNLRHLGGADVILGDANAKMPGSALTRGAIYGFASVTLNGTTAFDLTATDTALLPNLIIYGEKDAQFGAATLALDTTGAGQDLIVGAPGAGSAAGAFYLYEGDTGLFDLSPRNYMEYAKTIDGPIPGGRFGAALAGTPTGTRPSWDLLVGAPATGRGDARPLAGAAYLFGGDAGWPFPLHEQLFGGVTGDQLGTVVAGGQINAGDTAGDLVAVAPNAASGRGKVYVQFDHVTR
jgi:hypothetical protein